MSSKLSPSWLKVFAPYAAAYFFSYLLRNINAVIAPELASEFALSPGQMGLLTAAYLIGFALMQLPVGLALDRYGPQRVVTSLLLIAAAGCLLFANASGFLQLILARGLMGVGVSACLMAGFKAFSLAFPSGQRAAVNAAIMAAGGLGALFATVPLNELLVYIRWEPVFVSLSLLGIWLVWLLSRVDDGSAAPEIRASGRLREQFGELRRIFACRSFLRFAPVTGLVVGGFIAIQGLWAAQWVGQVQQLDASDVSHLLMTLTLGLIAGYTLIACFLLGPKAGVSLDRVLSVGSLLIMLCQSLIVAELVEGVVIWWIYGAFSALMNVAYTSHAAHYPLALQGRANTCLNLGIFICGFLIQWGIGAAIDLGTYFGMGVSWSFKAAWWLLVAMQFCGLLWFVAYRAPQLEALSSKPGVV